MSLLDIILNRKSVYKLRKNYDRIREKADKEKDAEKRIAVLRLLDAIEPTLVALEEQILSNFERRRMIKYVSQNLGRAKSIQRDKDYMRYAQRGAYQARRQ